MCGLVVVRVCVEALVVDEVRVSGAGYEEADPLVAALVVEVGVVVEAA